MGCNAWMRDFGYWNYSLYMTYDGHCTSHPVTGKGAGSIFMQSVWLVQVDLWYRQETERKHYVRNELEVKKEKEM